MPSINDLNKQEQVKCSFNWCNIEKKPSSVIYHVIPAGWGSDQSALPFCNNICLTGFFIVSPLYTRQGSIYKDKSDFLLKFKELYDKTYDEYHGMVKGIRTFLTFKEEQLRKNYYIANKHLTKSEKKIALELVNEGLLQIEKYRGLKVFQLSNIGTLFKQHNLLY